MKAVIINPDASKWEVAERPLPELGAHQVLVRVGGVGINNADLKVGDQEEVAGFEFAGIVEAVGEGVADNLVGRSVMGMTSTGAFAQFAVANRQHLMLVPDSMELKVAGALPTALVTELGAMLRAGLSHGDSLLITAATSGIALVGIRIAKALGAGLVIGTTRRADRGVLIERAGADAVVVTGEENLAERVKELTGGNGVDIAFDHVGGSLLDSVIAATRPGGRVMSVGRLAGPTSEINLFKLAHAAVSLQSVSFGFTPSTVIGSLMADVERELTAPLASGSIVPTIGRAVDFFELPELLLSMHNGEIVDGKAVGVVTSS